MCNSHHEGCKGVLYWTRVWYLQRTNFRSTVEAGECLYKVYKDSKDDRCTRCTCIVVMRRVERPGVAFGKVKQRVSALCCVLYVADTRQSRYLDVRSARFEASWSGVMNAC